MAIYNLPSNYSGLPGYAAGVVMDRAQPIWRLQPTDLNGNAVVIDLRTPEAPKILLADKRDARRRSVSSRVVPRGPAYLTAADVSWLRVFEMAPDGVLSC